MKKIAIVTLMAGFFALLITGCKGKDKAAGGDPKTVLPAFFEKMAKKDIEGATKFATKETVEFPLKKEGGDWKVDFTMTTLMKMGMDAKKDKGDDLFKDETGTDTTLNELKDMLNSDTLKEKLDEMKNELKDALKEIKEEKEQ